MGQNMARQGLKATFSTNSRDGPIDNRDTQTLRSVNLQYA